MSTGKVSGIHSLLIKYLFQFAQLDEIGGRVIDRDRGDGANNLDGCRGEEDVSSHL